MSTTLSTHPGTTPGTSMGDAFGVAVDDERAGTGDAAGQRPESVSLRHAFGDARQLSGILKAVAHESRLIILCALLDGEKAVSELESILELRQPAVSQQLARLRGERLVRTHRRGKMIYYSLTDDPQVRAIVAFLRDLMKNGQAPGENGGAPR